MCLCLIWIWIYLVVKSIILVHHLSCYIVAKLDPNDRGSKTYIPKNFYRIGGSKTYIPKNFYTKTTYITLLSEKFGGSGAPPRPFYPSPMMLHISPLTYFDPSFCSQPQQPD
ncbi:hypothetical protein Hanom_Chr02g00099271 [Helianthus anomalus]